MSINVTVHGNPISIKKGKMVTCDTDSEFDRRRRIRLQQVRQQSKEIAADVRNRVRKEKEKQLSKVEQKSEQDLKRWQARKLLSLQQQYQDCLKEIGSAHTKAALEPDPDEILNELAAKNQAEADERSKVATEKKRNEDIQKRLELEKPIEIKKNTRKIEDARSAMVSQLNQESSGKKKKKKRKKINTDVTITNNLVSESDTTENFISDGENISGNIIDEKGKRKQKININLKSPEDFGKYKKNRKLGHSTTTDSSFGLSSPPSDSNDTTLSPDKNNKNYNRSILSANTTPRSSPQKGKHKKKDGFKKNTKISDRIQQRKLPEVVDKECSCDCDQTADNHLNFIHNIEKPDKIHRGTHKPNLQIESYKICDIQSETEQNHPKKPLPYVPTTTLRPDSLTNMSECQPNTCKYYDHLNRFTKEYNAQPVVQKISKQSIQVQPPTERSDSSELIKTMQARDKIAHTRGVRALEKVKIYKDYRQLMDELPLLQKQERLASMRTHNPTFHMPEERLQELERRRQSRIENIFEKYYHKSKTLETPLVTIRPVQKPPPAEEMKLPFRALDVTESPVQLNVAEWKTEEKPSEAETETQDQDDLENRQKALVDLLQRVNKQRELLLQEVSTLPSSSNLQKILQDEEILKLICPCPNNSREQVEKSHKEKGKTVVSTGTSPVAIKSSTKSKLCPEKEKHKRSLTTSSSNDSSSELIKKKKHKKVKSKKQKILIRNEGTQTSPLISNSKPSSTKTSTDSQEREKPTSCSCKIKTNFPDNCHCDKLYKDDAKKLCEIIIKMNDQTDVKVCKNDEQSASKKVILNVSKPTTKAVRSPTNGNDVSSSTTYMSLPDGNAQQKITKPPTNSKQRQQYKDLLHHKPQQTNIDRTDKCKNICPPANADPDKKEITPNLLRYIQKLLSMSRQSIDELTVSSISEVSTPGTSIVDTLENTNPFVQLQNVMQYYNLSFNDIQKHLSSDTSKSSIEYSAREIRAKAEHQTIYVRTSSTDSIEARKEQEKEALSKDVVDRNIQERKLPPPSSSRAAVEPEKSSSSSSSTDSVKSSQDHVAVAELVKETFGLQPEDMQEVPYANILLKYTDLTKTCCDRITKLTEMIDNVRLEKERLLSPEGSDRYETSVTSYLELPKMTNDSTRVESNGNKSGRHSNASSANTSMSQDAVDKYLLAIDTKSRPCPPTCPGNQNSEVNEDVDELPGIPKYTDSTDNQPMNILNSPVKQFLLNAKTKPPPSLLRNSNKYNLNIDMTPHELSTIVELDTIASSRNASAVLIPRSRSPEENIASRDENVPEKSKKDKDASGFATLTPENFKTSPKEQQSGSCETKCSQRSCDSGHVPRKSSLKKTPRSNSSSQERSVSELSGIQPLNSDRSTSSPEDMETILRNMGLGWAVSTLKKTHEALALSSSSSSVEASFRKRVSFKNSSNSNSNSDVSLKELLSKGLMRKISSSTLLNDSSGISPHLQDFDVSEIRDPTVLNRDGSQHRTSTPVQFQSKSTDSKKDLFTGDSDISSVRLHSEEFFLSIPNVSLDTNKSLSKSKE